MAEYRTAQTRLRNRLRTHHLPLFAATTLAVAAFYWLHPSSDWVMRTSFATAYPALILIVVTLLIGPWNVLRKNRNPVSSDLRRDIGIWAAAVGILHSVIGQNVHFRGQPWYYYIYSPPEHHRFPIRHDLFGFSNYTAIVGFLLLVALVATSNDVCLRALGARRWKQFQRWNYALFALVAAHGIGYLLIEKQKIPFVITVGVCLAAALLLQIAGFVARRTRPDKRQLRAAIAVGFRSNSATDGS